MKYELKVNNDADKLEIDYRQIDGNREHAPLVILFAIMLLIPLLLTLYISSIFFSVLLSILLIAVLGGFFATNHKRKETNIYATQNGLISKQYTGGIVKHIIGFLPEKEIKEIYIDQKERNEYELRCVSHDLREQVIMEGQIHKDVVEIRNQLINYFSLKNELSDKLKSKIIVQKEPKTNIVLTTPKPSKKEQKKETSRTETIQENNTVYTALHPTYDTILKGIVFFQNQEMQVVHLIQMDWNNGYEDKQMQLAGAYNNSTLIYFEKVKSMIYAYEEEILELYDFGDVNFSRVMTLKKITVSGEDYFLSNYKKGKSHIANGQRDFQSEQWIYDSKDKRQRIRILKKGDMYHYYKGQKLEVADFYKKNDIESLEKNQTLDLNKHPLKNKKPLKKKY